MGTIVGTFAGRTNHRLRMETQVASQNIPGNYSTINWQLYIERTSASSSFYGSPGGNSSISVGSNAWNGGAFAYDFRSTAVYQLGSGSYNIGHSADGTATYPFSATVNAPGSLGSASANGSEALPVIPRATTPTVSPTSGQTAATYTIGINAASSGFFHDVFYSLNGGANYVTLASNLPATTTSYSWTPAHTLLPNDSSVNAIILLRTKQSSGGTVLGDKTINLPLTVPASVKPVVSNVTWVDMQTVGPDIPTLMGGPGRFVQRWSKLRPTVTSTGSGGSTVTSTSVALTGQVTASGVTFGSAVSLSGAVPFTATATDSRDRNSALYSNTVPVVAYNFPSLPTPLVTRTSDAAGLTPDPTGTYLAITPSASVSALVFATIQKNLLEWQIRIKPAGGAFTVVQAWNATSVSGNTWTTKYIAAGPYSPATEWIVEVSIRDLFGKNGHNTGSTVVSKSLVVPSEQVAFDWDGRNGFGVGKYRSQGMVDVFGAVYHNNGKLVVDTEDARLVNPSLSTGTHTSAQPPSSYPVGVSQFAVGSGSDFPISFATVATTRVGGGRTGQMLIGKSNGRTFVRGEGDTDLWGPWRELSVAGENGSSFAVATGTTAYGSSVAAATGVNLTATFPAGRFTVPPRVFAISSSGRLNCAFTSSTTSSAIIRVDNNSSGANAAFSIFWQAIQMTSTSAD